MPMSGSHSKSSSKNRKPYLWSISIFWITILISAAISLISEEVMSESNVFFAFFILFAIVFLGIVMDVVGVAVTSATKTPFHSMAARKVVGAQDAIRLLNNADRVSSFSNDVIGDICGVISGSASAAIAIRVAASFMPSYTKVITLVLSALVAGFTVGGKSFGKTYAMKNCTNIVFRVGIILYYLRSFPSLFKRKNKNS